MTRDTGLAPERTRLAWRRTFLTLTVVAVLAGRLSSEGRSPLAAAGAMLIWLLALIVTYRRIRALTSSGSGTVGRALPLCAATTIGYAVLGTALLLLR